MTKKEVLPSLLRNVDIEILFPSNPSLRLYVIWIDRVLSILAIYVHLPLSVLAKLTV